LHPSDVILLPPYAGGLLFWPVFWILSNDRGALFWRLARIFAGTALCLAALAAVQMLAAIVGWPTFQFTNLYPIVNLGSLMISTVALFQSTTGQTRAFLERNFIAVTGIPFFTAMVMFLVGGCKNLDIALHPATAIATVLPRPESHSGRSKGIRYEYEVDGHSYTGSGDPGNPPYPPDTTFEIKFCTLHPSFSTARNPLEFLGIICVGSCFAGTASFLAGRSKRVAKGS
jgi:hypothetical protein